MKSSFVLTMLLLSMNVVIAISPRPASGQDNNLSFLNELNPSSYSMVVEDESHIKEVASAVRDVGNAMMSDPSICSILDDPERCDSTALSLTNYLSDYDFEDATSEIDEVKDRLAAFQQNPTFEALDSFTKANSDVAKSLYELLIRASNLDAADILPSDSNDENVTASPTSKLSMIMIEAGRITNNDNWISFGERITTLVGNFEQKYSEINAITGIANSVDADSLPRNQFGFYAIGFGIAGGLIAVGIIIQLLMRRKRQNRI